jgi:hypothetical protein
VGASLFSDDDSNDNDNNDNDNNDSNNQKKKKEFFPIFWQAQAFHREIPVTAHSLALAGNGVAWHGCAKRLPC